MISAVHLAFWSNFLSYIQRSDWTVMFMIFVLHPAFWLDCYVYDFCLTPSVLIGLLCLWFLSYIQRSDWTVMFLHPAFWSDCFMYDFCFASSVLIGPLHVWFLPYIKCFKWILTISAPISAGLPRQFIRKRSKEVEEGPGDDDIVVDRHQCGDDKHAVPNACTD